MSTNTLSGLSNLSSLFQFSATTGISQVSAIDSDGDNDGSSVSAPSRGGRFAEALSQAFAQIGVTLPSSADSNSTSTTGSASTTNSTTANPTQDIQAFMQDLFAALHEQSASGSASTAQATSNTADGDRSSTSSTSGASGHHHGGLSSLQNDLQGLIQQLSSASGSDSGNSTTSTLQTDYQNLLSSLGATSSNSNSLTNFLQALQQNLQGAPATGNVVSQIA